MEGSQGRQHAAKFVDQRGRVGGGRIFAAKLRLDLGGPIRLAADRANLRPMSADRAIDLANGDVREQPPEIARLLDFEVAAASQEEEAAKRGLHDVLRIDSRGEGLRKPGARQTDQAIRIATNDHLRRGGIIHPAAGQQLRGKWIGHDARSRKNPKIDVPFGGPRACPL